MTLIFGIVSRRSYDIPPGWLTMAQRAAAAWPSDETARHEDKRFAFLLRQRRTTPHAHLSPPIVTGDGHAVLFDGRIDNRSALAREIGFGDPDGASDGQLVHAGWCALGERLPERLIGDFAIAVRDGASGDLLIIRDQVGARPLFLAETPDYIAFASAMPPLLALPFVDQRANPQWTVDYLEEVKPDAEYCAVRGIRAVPSATILRLRAQGPTVRRRYWHLPAIERPEKIDHQDAVAYTRKLLRQAVNCRLAGVGRTASELSGGLDSSSIAVIAAELLAERGQRLYGVTQAMSHDFVEQFATLSEARYADAVYAAYPAIERLEVFNSTESLLDRLSETIDRHGAPPRNDFNGIANEAPDLLSQRGARVLLSGFGGDQLVTTGSASLPESMWAEGEWGQLVRLLMRSGARKRTLRAIFSRLPGLDALISPERPLQSPSPHLASDSARRATGYPGRADLHPAPPWQGTLQRRDEDFFRRPVMSYRLQDSQVGVGVRGIEYRYPLLDVRLLEFAHSLPSIFRMSSNSPRRLIRDVMAGKLPELVRQRRDKFGMTVPGVFVNVTRHAAELRAYIAGMATDPNLREYACYDDVLSALDMTLRVGEFPKETSVMAGEARYTGATHGQIVRLAMLGLWLRRNGLSLLPLAAFASDA